MTKLLNQEGQITQQAIDRAALAQGAQPKQLPLVLLTERIQHFAAEVGPVFQVVPIHPQHTGAIHMGVALEREGRLGNDFKGLPRPHKPQKSLIHCGIESVLVFILILNGSRGGHDRRANQSHRTALYEIQEARASGNLFIFAESAAAVVILGPIQHTLPSQEGAIKFGLRQRRIHDRKPSAKGTAIERR